MLIDEDIFGQIVVDDLIPRLREPRERFLGLLEVRRKELAKNLPLKDRLIAEYLATPTGRSKLAESMTAPLRTRRDYAAVGRRLFNVQPMPDPVPEPPPPPAPPPVEGFDDWLFEPEAHDG